VNKVPGSGPPQEVAAALQQAYHQAAMHAAFSNPAAFAAALQGAGYPPNFAQPEPGGQAMAPSFTANAPPPQMQQHTQQLQAPSSTFGEVGAASVGAAAMQQGGYPAGFAQPGLGPLAPSFTAYAPPPQMLPPQLQHPAAQLQAPSSSFGEVGAAMGSIMGGAATQQGGGGYPGGFKQPGPGVAAPSFTAYAPPSQMLPPQQQQQQSHAPVTFEAGTYTRSLLSST